jgi:Putative zinc-finger
MPDAQTTKVSMAEEELKPRFSKDGGNQGFASRARNCPKDEAIAAYVDGNVDATARSRVESHLANCAHCRGLVADVMKMKESDSPAIPLQLKQRAVALAAPRSRRMQWILWPAVAAGAACALIIGLWVRGPQEVSVPIPSSPTAPAPTVIAKSEPAPALRQPNGEVERSLTASSHLPVLIFPQKNNVLTPQQLEFKWKAIPQSRYYEIRVVTADGDLVWSAQSENLNLRPPSDLELKDGAYFVWISAYVESGPVQKSAPVRFVVRASR